MTMLAFVIAVVSLALNIVGFLVWRFQNRNTQCQRCAQQKARDQRILREFDEAEKLAFGRRL